MTQIIQVLSEVLADTYALYLKTQNFHWNVTGPDFKSLHLFFEGQYEELADAVDTVAERIRSLNQKAPASFSAFQKMTSIKEGDINTKATDMLHELAADHQYLSEKLKKAHTIADTHNDIGTASLFEDRIRAHEKMHWMLSASCS